MCCSNFSTTARNESEKYNPEQILISKLKSRTGRGGDCESSSVDVSADDYKAVLIYFASLKNPHKAEEWISKMEQDKALEFLQPDVNSYNAVIKAWAFSKEHNSAVRAERWFHRIREVNGQPNTESYNLLLKSLSRARGKSASIRESNALKAEQLLQEMQSAKQSIIQPTTDSFNSAMYAWVKCGGDIANVGEKVLKLLQDMEERAAMSASAVRPNTVSYTIAMNAFSTSAAFKQRRINRGNYHEEDVLEDVRKAESILNYMHDLHNAGVSDVVPDTQAHNSLISAWAKVSNEVNDSPLKAEAAFRRMIELEEEGHPYIAPDRISYNTVINAWLRTKSLNGAQRAEWLLRRMWERYEVAEKESGPNTAVFPDVETYNGVLKSWSLHDADKTEELLRELLDYELKGFGECTANTDSFAICISSFARFAHNSAQWTQCDGCQRALALLSELIKREKSGVPGCITNLSQYNSVMRTVAFSQSSSVDVLDVAFQTFRMLKSSRHEPDNITYKHFVRAIIKSCHVQKTKKNLLHGIIKMCCEDGQLCQGIINFITHGPFEENGGWISAQDAETLTVSLFGDWPVPKNWSRNLKIRDLAPNSLATGYEDAQGDDIRRQLR
eukprot:CAMPEP_0196824550 /NCGR_PEP_ID=MMETSP1362-20130617/92296_1 /TAXON_ID=163516 /ORGANISM="Leptocylindrus danicus, Strain CCMP1856" /LENGTH=613 /DNA_ID=CAMNT_0042204847 /DNA_START=288 /DNA_END=2129 /DNA_ORIENTATION=-